MRIWRGFESIIEPFGDFTLAIGVFDGIHRGHQELISQGVEDAHQNRRPFAVLTFDRHPSELVAPDKAPPYLTTESQRISLLSPLHVDDVIFARFDERFRQLSPESFLRFVVCGILGARSIFVGTDFRFGLDQAGDATYLLDSRSRFDFDVHVMKPVLVSGNKASSSRIRQLIAEGNVTEAAEILGRPYALEGHVVEGQKLGRKLGFPTANIVAGIPMVIPADGVYAAWIKEGENRWMGACSIGFRPAVGGTERTIEVYLLDFEGDLYGRTLEIEFTNRLRDELPFPSLDDLVSQIEADVTETRRILQPEAVNSPEV